jgi:Fe-S-cluster containining protein
MRKQIEFQCTNCGACCKNLLEQKDLLGLRGLYLQKNETHLFPKDHVKPMYAATKGKVRPRPGEIFAYQLDLATCPHLNAENKCSIYNERPLICRSFPFEAMAIARKCPEIAKQIQQGEEVAINNDSIKTELKANKSHFKFLRPYVIKGGFWLYDLRTGEWKRQTQRNTLPNPKVTKLMRNIQEEHQHGLG